MVVGLVLSRHAWCALGDERGLQELTSCFRAQFASGFVPHMRYLEPNTLRGPLEDRSSYTQPPIYAHAARVMAQAGFSVDETLVSAVTRGLDWLWSNRMSDDGLLVIVHPWESGSDDSPRWDSWVKRADYRHADYSEWDGGLVPQTVFSDEGAAVWSHAFVAIPAAFNAFAAHAALELARLTGDSRWTARGEQLGDAMDQHLWDEGSGLWLDRPVVGGGPSVAIPTLDGVFGTLVTADVQRAERALTQLVDPSRFGAPYGLRFLPVDCEEYDANEYWRGPAWPQLNYMAYVAAQRWGATAIAGEIAAMTMRAAVESGFSEYWNVEDGRSLGARPQGWAALAAAMTL